MMKDNIDKLLDQLKRHEGVEKMPYVDTVGKMTIGVGRNLSDNGLRDNEIEFLLMNDIAAVIEEAKTYDWYDGLSGERKSVIVNMIFNLGKPRFDLFQKFQQALSDGDYQKASDEMLDSKWAKQVGQRAVELSMQMQKGQWQ